jgi:hypothetical protein
VHAGRHDGRVSGQRRQALGVSPAANSWSSVPRQGRPAGELFNDDADLERIDRERGGGPGQCG